LFGAVGGVCGLTKETVPSKFDGQDYKLKYNYKKALFYDHHPPKVEYNKTSVHTSPNMSIEVQVNQQTMKYSSHGILTHREMDRVNA
jgi:hypothetical protein